MLLVVQLLVSNIAYAAAVADCPLEDLSGRQLLVELQQAGGEKAGPAVEESEQQVGTEASSTAAEEGSQQEEDAQQQDKDQTGKEGS